MWRCGYIKVPLMHSSYSNDFPPLVLNVGACFSQSFVTLSTRLSSGCVETYC